MVGYKVLLHKGDLRVPAGIGRFSFRETLKAIGGVGPFMSDGFRTNILPVVEKKREGLVVSFSMTGKVVSGQDIVVELDQVAISISVFSYLYEKQMDGYQVFNGQTRTLVFLKTPKRVHLVSLKYSQNTWRLWEYPLDFPFKPGIEVFHPSLS